MSMRTPNLEKYGVGGGLIFKTTNLLTKYLFLVFFFRIYLLYHVKYNLIQIEKLKLFNLTFFKFC